MFIVDTKPKDPNGPFSLSNPEMKLREGNKAHWLYGRNVLTVRSIRKGIDAWKSPLGTSETWLCEMNVSQGAILHRHRWDSMTLTGLFFLSLLLTYFLKFFVFPAKHMLMLCSTVCFVRGGWLGMWDLALGLLGQFFNQPPAALGASWRFQPHHMSSSCY